MKTDFAAFVDTLRKLDAKGRLPNGGSQYTMEVALGPMASAKNQAMLRLQKIKPVGTLPLREIIKRNS